MDAAKAPEFNGDLVRQRAFYQQFNDDRLVEMRRVFRTRERHETLNAVHVQVVEPADGVSARNRDRVLINVHGGAFMWGAGSGALVEAIPIAATMGVFPRPPTARLPTLITGRRKRSRRSGRRA